MMFVLTEWNECKGGLFDMLCVAWVGRTCMTCHYMRIDVSFCILAALDKIAYVMFIFDVLSGRVNSPNLLSVLDLITPRYPHRGTEFLRIDFHRTNYGIHGDSLMRSLVCLVSV
jgi:hypothetical protein